MGKTRIFSRTKRLAKSKAMLLFASVALTVLLAASVALAVTPIDTRTQWNGEEYVSPFGYPDTATYGQVVTAPVDDTRLDSFTFLMDVPDTATFRGEVYAWGGDKATGPNLYESAPRTTSGSGGFEEITFDTGGVQLAPGQRYVLFATISKDYEASSRQNEGGRWGFVESSDPYAGGEFVSMNNSDDFNRLLTDPWDQSPFDDLAFKASFSNPSPNCTITGTSGIDHLVGTDGRDVICARGGADTVLGMGGSDILYGGRGLDILMGGAGSDVLYGGAGTDSLVGGPGEDRLVGGPGLDVTLQ